jgi:hypothetical protein
LRGERRLNIASLSVKRHPVAICNRGIGGSASVVALGVAAKGLAFTSHGQSDRGAVSNGRVEVEDRVIGAELSVAVGSRGRYNNVSSGTITTSTRDNRDANNVSIGEGGGKGSTDTLLEGRGSESNGGDSSAEDVGRTRETNIGHNTSSVDGGARLLASDNVGTALSSDGGSVVHGVEIVNSADISSDNGSYSISKDLDGLLGTSTEGSVGVKGGRRGNTSVNANLRKGGSLDEISNIRTVGRGQNRGRGSRVESRRLGVTVNSEGGLNGQRIRSRGSNLRHADVARTGVRGDNADNSTTVSTRSHANT